MSVAATLPPPRQPDDADEDEVLGVDGGALDVSGLLCLLEPSPDDVVDDESLLDDDESLLEPPSLDELDDVVRDDEPRLSVL